MAKILKHLVFGQKKNPPTPPRPDYEGDKDQNVSAVSQTDGQYTDHNYENLPKFKCKDGGKVQFAEKANDELVVFNDYSEPADLRTDLCVSQDVDPLYVSPLDDCRGCSAPPLDQEDMYCLPCDSPEDALPCLQKGEDVYDVVPDLSDDDASSTRDISRVYEYDEPWEWSVGARLTSTLQVSPTPSIDETRRQVSGDEENSDEEMQRRLLYETAFDSRVRRKDPDDLDGLVQSPLLVGQTPVARAASRSSFGSTSGSSASSTPTHQPHRRSPHLFTPTERRRVTLVRDSSLPRSLSPRQGLLRGVVNQNYERKISLGNGHWDSVSGSDKSSSQESMSVDVSTRNCAGLRCSSVDGRNCADDSQSPQNCPGQLPRNFTDVFKKDGNGSAAKCADPMASNSWKEMTRASSEDSTDGHDRVSPPSAKKSAALNSGVQVLPTDARPFRTKSSRRNDRDSELKENSGGTSWPTEGAAPRPRAGGLLSEVRPTDNVQPLQSPESDHRSSEDYDPPWDLKVKGSISVPERLSGVQSVTSQMSTSVTHDQLKEEGKPNGPSSRPNLNLNLSGERGRSKKNLVLDFGCSALAAVGEKVDPQLTLEKQGWYHGSISRVDAESKLRVLKEGSYLVRNSESSKHDYSLSLKSARGFMHMKIVPTSEGRFILGQFSNPFTSIPEMIEHYSINKLPIKGAEHMSLLYPVIDQLL